MAKAQWATELGESVPVVIEPLAIEAASLLAHRDPPPPRDAICEGIALNAGRVHSLTGNGGFGKTTIAHQIAIATATSTELWGMPVSGGPVVAIWCEDEQHEVDRKTRAISAAESIELESLDNLYLLSRDGQDNALCCFDRDLITLTDFYGQLDATIAAIKPRLTIIDTAADVFAGDFMSTPHVRQFIKVALGGLCARHGTAVLLLAHPSASAMATGDGAGFSVAWNNSVRSRLYLRRPKSDDAEAIADRRVLEVRKANYGPTGGLVPLVYCAGRFILDPEPIEEGARKVRVTNVDTRLSMAVMGYFKEHAASGQIVALGALSDSLRNSGAIPPKSETNQEAVRKLVQRVLKSLVSEGLLAQSNVPRGYRMVMDVIV